MKLYHFTKRDRVQGIISDGLKPCIQGNSQLCGENIPSAYLCTYDDAKFWQWLLDADVLLELTPIGSLQLTCQPYGEYAELVMRHRAHFRVQEIVMPNDVRALYYLQESYIAGLCEFALEACDFIYSKIDNDYSERFLSGVYSMVQIVPRLRYDKMLATTKNCIIEDYSDEGEYAFTDCYRDTNVPILHVLRECPKHEKVYLAAMLLFNTVATYFGDCKLVKDVIGADL